MGVLSRGPPGAGPLPLYRPRITAATRRGEATPADPPVPRVGRAAANPCHGAGRTDARFVPPVRPTMPTDPHGPLAGLRVLDASRVLAGPLCGQLLGDLGAEFIKVERPVAGDDTRAWGPPFAGPLSAYYLSCNRNKLGIALDLAKEEGLRLFHELARR